MLRLATVFSGIGAIEHALQRMEIKHKIVFACDNGDVNIFEKKIPHNLAAIENEVESLDIIIRKIKSKGSYEYISDLEQHLKRIHNQVEMVKQFNLEGVDITEEEVWKFYFQSGAKSKEVISIIDNYELGKGKDIYLVDKVLLLELIMKEGKKNTTIEENIKGSQLLDFFSSNENILIQNDYKKYKKEIKEIAEDLSMLHEKIEVLHINNELSKIKDYKKKKEFVDELYKGKEKSNFVRQSYFNNYEIKDEDFHWNVSFLDGKQYKGEVDLFVGGSPCQSFSMVGKQRGLQDTRGTLFYEYARLVKEIQPKIFIYENVRAVLSNDSGRTWETMKAVFDEVGYNWYKMVLNAKDYGVPQNRERIFVVGFRKDLTLENEFIEPKTVELNKTMKDFLMENVSGKYYLNRKGVDFVTDKKNLQKKWTQISGDIQLCQKKNQQFNWHGDFVFEEENKNKEKTIQDLEKYFLSEKVRKYVLASGTGNFYSRPEIDLDIARPLIKTMHKMHRAGVDNYVTTDGRIRKLTPRECLRLMGFCDSFKIVVSDTQIYQQAGNSIVVDVLINIMKSIIKSYPKIIQ